MFSNQIPKPKNIILDGKTYTLPSLNPGHIIDIESNKQAFSNGKYVDLVKTPSPTSLMSLDFIDAFSTLYSLIPELKKDLRINSLFELDLPIAKKVVKVYKNEILPWYLEYIKFMQSEDEDEKELMKKVEKQGLEDKS